MRHFEGQMMTVRVYTWQLLAKCINESLMLILIKYVIKVAFQQMILIKGRMV